MHGHSPLDTVSSPYSFALSRSIGFRLARFAGVLAMLALAACSGGGSGGGDGGASNAGPTTGSVGILATDADTDQFCSIWVTIDDVLLLSDTEGPISIFDGQKTVDLLDLRDNTDLITVGRKVPAGLYSKIRLVVDDKSVELEPCDGSDPILAKLSSGKIDLNPRGEFRVRGGQLMLVRLDMDAEKSIHIAGPNYNFRPVVFVDILTANDPTRLVRLFGDIAALDPDLSRFDLCGSHAVARPADDEDDERDSCVEIQVEEGTDNDTSIFLTDAVPGEFADLVEGDFAMVLGRFIVDGEDLRVSAEVVQQDPESIDRVRGTVASEADDDAFDLEVDPDQEIEVTDDLLAVLLQPGTKIFTRDGEALEPSDLMVDQRARVFGALDLTEGDEHMDATVIFVKSDEVVEPPDRVSGTFTSWDDVTREMELDAGAQCVSVPEDADVFLGMLVGDTIVFDTADPADFEPGFGVTAFGADDDPCFEADSVLGFDLGTDD